MILTKIYVALGDASKVIEALEGYSFLFEKKDPNKKTKYVAVSSGPHFADLKKINEVGEVFEKIYMNIEEESKKLIELSTNYGVSLHMLTEAQEEAIRLFSEPFVIFGMLYTKFGEGIARKKGTLVLLGKKKNEEKAEETIDSFLNTVVIGKDELAKKQMHVLIENCSLAGVTAIVFDEDKSFEKIDSPNRAFPYEEYPDLQPIGMSVRHVMPGDVSININHLTPNMFCEIIGIANEGENINKPTAEILNWALGKGEFKSFIELHNILYSVEETKKFHAARVSRILNLLDIIYTGVFNGEVKIDDIILSKIRGMNTIVRIDVSMIPDSIKIALVYSVMRSLLEQNKGNMNVFCFVPFGEKIIPITPKTEIQKEFVDLLFACFKQGIGFCTAAPYDIDINQEIVDQSTMKIEFIKDNEIAIKEANARSYRILLRPTLSM